MLQPEADRSSGRWVLALRLLEEILSRISPSSRMVNVSLVDHSSGNVNMPSENPSFFKKASKVMSLASFLSSLAAKFFKTGLLLWAPLPHFTSISYPFQQGLCYQHSSETLCHHFYTKNHLSKYTISIQNQN